VPKLGPRVQRRVVDVEHARACFTGRACADSRELEIEMGTAVRQPTTVTSRPSRDMVHSACKVYIIDPSDSSASTRPFDATAAPPPRQSVPNRAAGQRHPVMCRGEAQRAGEVHPAGLDSSEMMTLRQRGGDRGGERLEVRSPVGGSGTSPRSSRAIGAASASTSAWRAAPTSPPGATRSIISRRPDESARDVGVAKKPAGSRAPIKMTVSTSFSWSRRTAQVVETLGLRNTAPRSTMVGNVSMTTGTTWPVPRDEPE